MRSSFLDGVQRGRLVDLLEESVEDYGIKDITRYTGRSGRYISGIIDETVTQISHFTATRICRALAINPLYVYMGEKPIYDEGAKPNK